MIRSEEKGKESRRFQYSAMLRRGTHLILLQK